jgi:hypothetical protein
MDKGFLRSRDIRFGSQPDMTRSNHDVRYSPKSGQRLTAFMSTRPSTAHGNGEFPTDLKRDAVAAWRRFVWCVRSLPAHEAAPLWQAVLTEAMAHAHAQTR